MRGRVGDCVRNRSKSFVGLKEGMVKKKKTQHSVQIAYPLSRLLLPDVLLSHLTFFLIVISVWCTFDGETSPPKAKVIKVCFLFRSSPLEVSLQKSPSFFLFVIFISIYLMSHDRRRLFSFLFVFFFLYSSIFSSVKAEKSHQNWQPKRSFCRLLFFPPCMRSILFLVSCIGWSRW